MKLLFLTSVKVDISDAENYTKTMSKSGGWISMHIRCLRSSDFIERADVISVAPDYDNHTEISGNIVCHFIKGKTVSLSPQKELTREFQKIIDEAKPDIIDIQGAEFTVGKDLLCCKYDCPVIVTLQGFPTEISKAYDAGMPRYYRWIRTFFDWTHLKGMYEKQKYMRKRGKISEEILGKADYFVGRTEWDHAVSWRANPKAKYFYVGRLLRDDFYSAKWDINNIERHSIFGIQGRDSAKGLHIMLEALNILKKIYPDVKLYIPGAYTYNSSRLKMPGYEKYIRKLIKKYSLEKNVEFTGSLNASQMAERLLKCNVFCLHSMNENSPNSLGEAMAVGAPCVSTYVGGVATYVEPEKTALVCDRTEAGTMAYMINRIFENDELAQKLSDNAYEDARRRFDIKTNSGSIINVYKEISGIR